LLPRTVGPLGVLLTLMMGTSLEIWGRPYKAFFVAIDAKYNELWCLL
jgi:hypothetical protein